MQSRAFALVRAAIVATLFVSLWVWFFPRWLAMSRGVALVPQWSIAAVALMIAGALVMLRCVWDFAWTGRGTPAPFDPPRRLVVRGLYRRVRNPMYVGMGLFLGGEALALPMIRTQMFILIAVAALAVHTFILVYEEPTLRRLFDGDYEEYRRNVRRWLPRATPWSFDNADRTAVPSPNLD